MSSRTHPAAPPPPQATDGRFFHGWVMLGVAVCMAFATMPGQTVLVSLFNASIRESLGLSILQVSGAYTVATICAGLPLPFVGRVADVIGLRWTVGMVAIGFAAGLVVLQAAMSLVTLGLGFFMIRFLGQGSLGMLSGHVLAMWFERRLGTAHALLVVGGFAAGSAIMPRPTAWLIAEHGWERTLLYLAGGVVVLVLPLVLLVFRNRPEDIGQHLDGDPVEHARHDVLHGGDPPPGDPAFTARQAMSTRPYWILLANMFATGMIGTALLFHMQALLEQAGLEGTERQAAVAIQTWPIVFGLSSLGVGWLADRYAPSRLMPVSVAMMIAGMLICAAAAGGGLVETRHVIPLMATGMGVYGASQSMITGVANPTIARYFGRTHHGSIRGTIATGTVIGTGAGPFAVALGWELAGEDFVPVIVLCAVLAVPLGIAAAFLRPPTPPRRRDLTPEHDEPDPPQPSL